MKNASFSATFSANPTRTVRRPLGFPLTPDFAGFRIHEMTAPHFVNVRVWMKINRFIQSPAKLFGEKFANRGFPCSRDAENTHEHGDTILIQTRVFTYNNA